MILTPTKDGAVHHRIRTEDITAIIGWNAEEEEEEIVILKLCHINFLEFCYPCKITMEKIERFFILLFFNISVRIKIS